MDRFEKQAIRREEAFIKRYRKRRTMLTCTGKENRVVDVTRDAFFIQTATGERPFKIPRARVRAALREFFYRRVISRADLGAFSGYNSSLMALLRVIFADIAKVVKTVKYGYRLIIKGVRFFPAGADRTVQDLERIASQGYAFVLMSYFHLREQVRVRWKHHLKRLGLKLLLDSGEFSRYRASLKGKQTKAIVLEEYARFIVEHKDVLFAFMNLDVVGEASASRANFERLTALTGRSPIPIWHVQSPWEELDLLVEDEHPIVAIGGSVFLSESKRRIIFDQLFKKHPDVAFHWLGGSSSLLHVYDWFSADSSSWLAGRKAHRLLTASGQVRAPEHWSSHQCLLHNLRYLSLFEWQYAQSDLGLELVSSQELSNEDNTPPKRNLTQINLFDFITA